MKTRIRPYEGRDRDAVVDLWIRCGLMVPTNDADRDIRRKVEDSGDLFLVGEIDGRLVATVMAGYEGHRGWLNYLAVHPDRQRQGIGREMVSHAEALLEQRGCPKVNLQIRSGNSAVIAFYRELGYEVEERVSMGKRLVLDRSEQ
jgi:ribosomal protein S18 acetylase RimI-like enzyme